MTERGKRMYLTPIPRWRRAVGRGDGVDEQLSAPFLDELHADDRTPKLGDGTVCWAAEVCADQADALELTPRVAVDGADQLA